MGEVLDVTGEAACLLDVVGVTPSVLAAAKVGDCVYGPTFQANGIVWRLRIYLGGKDDTCAGHISVILYLVSSPGDIDITASVAVIKCYDETHDFRVKQFTKGKGWGLKNFVSHADASKNLQSGVLTLSARVVFTVPILSMRVQRHLVAMSDAKTEQEAEAQQLAGLLASPVGADITLKCSEGRVKAHSLVLALRSPVLASLVARPREASTEPGAPAAAGLGAAETGAGAKKRKAAGGEEQPGSGQVTRAAKRKSTAAAQGATTAAFSDGGGGTGGGEGPGGPEGGGEEEGVEGEGEESPLLRTIVVPDVIDRRALEHVLHFIYTGASPKLESAEEASPLVRLPALIPVFLGLFLMALQLRQCRFLNPPFSVISFNSIEAAHPCPCTPRMHTRRRHSTFSTRQTSTE